MLEKLPYLIVLSSLCLFSIPANSGRFPPVFLSYLPHELLIGGEQKITLPLALHNTTPQTQELTLECFFPDKPSIYSRQSISLQPYSAKAIVLHLELPTPVPDKIILQLSAQGETSRYEVSLISGIDLSNLIWKVKYDKERKGQSEGYQLPDYDDSAWEERKMPSLWNDLGYTWCRVKFRLPSSWRDSPLYLIIGAIDDNDVTYFNGEKIGSTTGWDILRNYRIPPELVRWGEENTLAIMVDNINAGGGIYKPPIIISRKPVIPTSPWRVLEKEPTKPAPKKIGNPLPVRNIKVENGVLYYEDGKEIALWGTNIYPNSWMEYDNIKKLGLDHKKVTDEDFQHLKKMGINVIRMHIFEKEIADEEGNLVENEHLDILDYVVYKCEKENIYLFLTPVAWWWSPNQIPCFSNIPKQNMMVNKEVVEKTKRYIQQLLTRKNPYTGKKYIDHKGFFAIEIMNEPEYFTYDDIKAKQKQGADYQWNVWEKWCEERGINPEEPSFFPLFRYEYFANWLGECYKAIRETRATQVVAAPFFGSDHQDDLIEAIYLSPCEAITYSAYPGGWERMNDSRDILEEVDANYRWFSESLSDVRLADKARLVYEFDAPALLHGAYVYPMIACLWRSLGTQVACQFQYDSIATAEFNSDWWNHYLNYLYTPSKTVSFIIGGEVFRSLPRFFPYPLPNPPLRERVFDGFAVSFPFNLSLMWKDGMWMNSNPVRWNPFKISETPKLIIGVGSSPFVEYDGTGIYRISVGKNHLEIEVNPDAEINPKADPMNTAVGKTLTKLYKNQRTMKIKLGGKVYELKVYPGVYKIRR
ncbi:hypothetical protein H5T87_06650 [bacterium]|nr:hypothetical protein [bacterium]